MFNLKLESFEAAAKPKIIKEVKSMLGLSLVDSKSYSRERPQVVEGECAQGGSREDHQHLEGTGCCSHHGLEGR